MSGLRLFTTLDIESINKQKNEIMKNLKFTLIMFITVFTFSLNAETPGKYVSTKTHIKFFSTTPAEDIEANNTTSVSTINQKTGEVVFSVPMQGFEFDKSMMQKHFNNDKFLDTKTHPKAKLKVNIINIDQVDFTKDGTYSADVEGELTIKDVTKSVKEIGTLRVNAGVIELQSKFKITLADYGIYFVDGKPSTNVAKSVEVTVQAEYQ